MRKNLQKKFDIFRIPAAVVRVTILLLVAFSIPHRSLSQAELLKDIAWSEDLFDHEYRYLINGNGTFLFVERNQLWKSDGTVEGTESIMNFQYLASPLWIGNALYFTANDGIHGPELWKSDGTTGGTVLVKDIYPGGGGSMPAELANVNGTLFFVAEDGVHGREVWKSDGTAPGTVLVRDIISNKGTSNPSYLTNVAGTLFFTANDGQHGYELWKSDGTTTGTMMVKDIRTGASTSPASLTAVNALLFFVANDGSGKELWISDGTINGTSRLRDIMPGSGSPGIDNMTAVNNTLFFTANDGIHGHELWKSDGTTAGTVLVKDMTPGRAGSHGEVSFSHAMSGFKNMNGTLFFAAYEGESYNIWKSDGTETGTVPLFAADGPGIANPIPQFTFMNGAIYFFNIDGEPYADEYALFRMNADGTDPQRVIGIYYYDYYNPYYPKIVNVGDHLYIAAQLGGGTTLIKSDGTVAGTKEFIDVRDGTLSSYPDNLVTFNGQVYFDTYVWEDEYYYTDQEGGFWKTNGTSAGTDLVVRGLRNTHSIASDNILYVAAFDYYRFVLWMIDRAGNSTELVDLGYDQSVTGMRLVGDLLYFYTNKGEVWRSDGTSAGTYLLMQAQAIRSFETVGSRLLFHAVLPSGDEELWRSDGTVATTTRVQLIRRAGMTWNPSRYYPSAVVGNVFYFVADNGSHGNEIFRSTGTAAGTFMAMNTNDWDRVESDGTEFDIAAMASFQDKLYFSAREITLGGEDFWSLRSFTGTVTTLERTDAPFIKIIPAEERLYLISENSDGSHDLWTYQPGAPLLKLGPVEGSLHEGFDFELVNGVMYYSTKTGTQLWRTDGTVCGTLALPTGTTGAYPMEALGNLLIFSSTTPAFGTEPWSLDLSMDPGNPCEPGSDECMASGTITREIWEGVSGARVTDIPVNDEPTSTSELSLFEGPTNDGSNYGSRISGYICPPETGTYYFYIASNDHSELWMSGSDDPAGKTMIAYVTGATGPRQWNKFGTQRSMAITLVKGRTYYIEALHKQGVGTDHIAVGWELPDGTLERPIPGNRLSPFESSSESVGRVASTSSAADIYAEINVYPNPLLGGEGGLHIAGYEGIDEQVDTDVEIININGETVFKDRITCGGDCGSRVMNIQSALVPGIYLVNLKANGVRMSRRLLVK